MIMKGMFRMQAEERKAFNYPPFCRLVRISIKHKDKALLNHYSDILGNDLKTIFGKTGSGTGISSDCPGTALVYQNYPYQD